MYKWFLTGEPCSEEHGLVNSYKEQIMEMEMLEQFEKYWSNLKYYEMDRLRVRGKFEHAYMAGYNDGYAQRKQEEPFLREDELEEYRKELERKLGITEAK
jgi:hypothetical protein